MSRTASVIIFLAAMGLMDAYIYLGIHPIFPQGIGQLTFLIVWLLFIIISIGGSIGMLFTFRGGITITSKIANIFIGLAFTLFFVKATIVLFLVGEDIYRGGRWLAENLHTFTGSAAPGQSMVARSPAIGIAGLITSLLPLSFFFHGITVGKHSFRVITVQLSYPDLPEGFDGMKIAQISDIHAGSFDEKSTVEKGLNLLQDQHPDLILLTGDLVNNIADEVDPFIESFQQLSAPLGKYSVMGNHDYGSYIHWDTHEKEEINTDRVRKKYQQMGFQVLDNDSIVLESNDHQIRLAGVENWGRNHAPRRAKMEDTFANTNDDEFTILMSHDPTHWEDHIVGYPRHVHLTLSGHTHGGQMGIELPGFKWSLASLDFDRWAGLFQENEQYLYVNRGFGFIGYPGRAGIWPEITLIELRKSPPGHTKPTYRISK